MREAIGEAYYLLIIEGLSIEGLCSQVLGLCNSAFCYEAVELLLDVLAANGVAKSSQLLLTDEIASKLQLNPVIYRPFREERLIRLRYDAS